MKSFTLCLLLIVTSVANAEPRTWTDSTGTFKVQAEFVEFKNGNAVLLREDGRKVSVPVAKLSKPDQDFVRAELRRRRAEGSKPTVTPKPTPNANMVDGEWPQWRGPNRDGVSTEKGLLDRWDADGPPLLWSTRGAGRGYSSVSVAGGRIFTMGNRESGEELICFNQEDGKPQWTAAVGRGGDCNCTPTVDGDLVFGLGRAGDLVCAETAGGRVVWRKNFARDFGGRMMSGWGYSESPLVDGDKLICTPGGDRAMIAALNKRTGEVLWRTPMQRGGKTGKDGAGYSSVVVSNGGGVKQYVTLVGRGVISVDAETGRPLWHYPRVANTTANVPTPIVKGDYIFCSSGYGDGGSALLKLEKRGGGVAFRELKYYRSNQLQNHHGGMVLVDDHIFLGHGHNNGLPTCIELATGRVKWGPVRGPGRNSAAVVYADGHLYFRYEDGTMALIEANTQEYRLKGQFRIASVTGKSWPHPVIAGGKLYLRDQDQLHCYNVSKP